MKKYISILIALIIPLTLSGCKDKYESYDHDDIVLNVGETISLELSNIPDGLTKEDFEWHIGTPTGADSGLVMTMDGVFKADAPGSGTISALAKYRGTEYHEYFDFTIASPVNKLTLNYTELNILTGSQFDLTAQTDVQLTNADQIEWASSDTNQAVLALEEHGATGGKGLNNEFALLRILSPGEVIITARYGDLSAECHVKAYDKSSADDVLNYINAGGTNGFYTINGASVTLDEPQLSLNMQDEQASVQTRLGANANGKYVVLLSDSASSTPLGLGFMALLPPEYLPQRYEEVEYIIRAGQGEPIHICDYSNGVKGMQPTVDIVLENAVTGEILKVFETLYGSQNFPVEVIVAEGATEYFSAPPDESDIYDSVTQALCTLWSEKYETVTVDEG